MPERKQSRTGVSALDRMGEALDRSMATQSAPPEPLRGRPRRVRRIAVGVAIAACLVLALVLVRAGNDELSTEDAIARIADASSLAELPRDDQYVQTRSTNIELATLIGDKPADGSPPRTLSVPTANDVLAWVSVARTGRMIIDFKGPIFPLPGQQEEFEAKAEELGVPTERAMRRGFDVLRLSRFDKYRIGNETLTRSQVLAYPTDPEQILAKVQASLPVKSDVLTWDSLITPLMGTSAPLPLDLRAGMVQALGLIPGVHVIDDDRDPKGRPAYALEFSKGGVQRRVYFDRKNSAVLHTQNKIIEPQLDSLSALPVGTVIGEYTLLEQSVVDDMPRLSRRVSQSDRSGD